MSNMRANFGAGTFAKIVAYVLLVLMVAALAGGLIYYFTRPQGMYVSFGEDIISESTDIAIQPDGTQNIFTIASNEGFGSYSVSDCFVKIVPNVDEAHDFDFMLSGEVSPYLYGAESDLSAAFVEGYDGNGIKVSSDGSFTITTDKMTMTEILKAVYPDRTVTLDKEISDVEFGQYPYFAISVTSPDGSETMRIPFRYYFEVVGIELDKEVIVF